MFDVAKITAVTCLVLYYMVIYNEVKGGMTYGFSKRTTQNFCGE